LKENNTERRALKLLTSSDKTSLVFIAVSQKSGTPLAENGLNTNQSFRMGTKQEFQVQFYTIWFFSLGSILTGRFITDTIYLHYSIYNVIPLMK